MAQPLSFTARPLIEQDIVFVERVFRGFSYAVPFPFLVMTEGLGMRIYFYPCMK